MNLLLLSNSSSDAGYLVHALPWIRTLAQAASGNKAVFLPYAGVTRTWDEYADLVETALAPTGLVIRSLHREADPLAALDQADLIVVGGGNTFNLLGHVRALRLLDPIAQRVRAGRAAYLGWSAGANLACPTIRTTNDMPIVDPGGFDALGLVPFQINAHYTNAHPAGHRGETRDQRLAEFCLLSPGTPVLGLREGTGLAIEGNAMTLVGEADAVLLNGDAPARRVSPGRVEVSA